jgi:hypothetical protein
LAKRIINPRFKSPFLFSVADLQPKLDELNPAIDDVLLDLGSSDRGNVCDVAYFASSGELGEL